MRHFRGRNGPLTKTSFLTMTSAAALIAASVTLAAPAFADDATAQRWIDTEFQPSTLSKADQLKELQWFEDRKSTRLNSSHANISYAVFCLKKKKKQCH